MSSAPAGTSSAAQMNKIEEEEQEQEPPTFITVLYGDNESAIFNPRCRTHILLEYIRRKCECDKETIIDLIDFEGDVKNLSTAKTFDYAHEQQSVTSRESYVLVKVEKTTGKKEQTKFVPLLNNLEEVNPELHDKLNNIVVERAKVPTKDDKTKKQSSKRNSTHNPPNANRLRTAQSPPSHARRGSQSRGR